MKVKATESALKLLEDIKAQHGDELLFHQSGGCCDGSAPMCYPRKEYLVGNSDVKLGEIGEGSLVRPVLVDIFRLLLRESGEFYTQFLEVKASDFLVQLLGQDIDAHFLGIPAQVYLCKDLVGEGVGHHK